MVERINPIIKVNKSKYTSTPRRFFWLNNPHAGDSFRLQVITASQPNVVEGLCQEKWYPNSKNPLRLQPLIVEVCFPRYFCGQSFQFFRWWIESTPSKKNAGQNWGILSPRIGVKIQVFETHHLEIPCLNKFPKMTKLVQIPDPAWTSPSMLLKPTT